MGVAIPKRALSVRHKKSPLLFLFVLCGAVVLLLSGCSKTAILIKKPEAESSRGECVVLMHGLARTYRSMASMQEALTTAGYHTVNLGYPSTKQDIQTIAEVHFPDALKQCREFSPTSIHFVTHSLGGIVLRQAVKNDRPPELGRVVMLSPPNRGSSVTDRLKDWFFYKWLNGPAGQQLSTADDSVPNRLGPVDYPVGIITGDYHFFVDAWFSSIIPGKDDGKVSVERAQVDGMSDFLVVHESHPFIMNSRYVQSETLHFFQNGVFKHQADPHPPVSGADWFSLPSE